MFRVDCVAFVLAFDEDIPGSKTDKRARIRWAESIFKSGTLAPGFGEEPMETKLASEHVILSFISTISVPFNSSP